MPEALIIVQARMTSQRLPGKVLLPVLGRPLLSYLIERLKRVTLASRVVVATSDQATDDPIVQLCKKEAVLFFRGSLDDVLLRYFTAAKQYKADPVIRICSDSVLIDPEIVDEAIAFYLESKPPYDYVCNFLQRHYPRGYEVEVFSFDALAQTKSCATKKEQREHVTPYIYYHPEQFSLGGVAYQTDESALRLVVDTPEDFALISRILSTLYPMHPQFTLQDVLKLLKEHPEWLKINAHVKQRQVQKEE